MHCIHHIFTLNSEYFNSALGLCKRLVIESHRPANYKAQLKFNLMLQLNNRLISTSGALWTALILGALLLHLLTGSFQSLLILNAFNSAGFSTTSRL
jgi:hypothetical protein